MQERFVDPSNMHEPTSQIDDNFPADHNSSSSGFGNGETAPKQPSSDLNLLASEQGEDGVLADNVTNDSGAKLQMEKAILSASNDDGNAHESIGKRLLSALWVFITCFFVTVASVLGTGILALPVKVGQSGFAPFLLTFSVCLVMQSFIVLFMIELLQRTQKIQQQLGIDPVQNNNNNNQRNGATTSDSEMSQLDGEMTPVDRVISSERIELLSGGNSAEPTTPNTVHHHSTHLLATGPDLHVMGTIFLGRFPRFVFELSVLQHFISILISYSLAGPQAYAGLLHIDYRFLISPFVIILTLVVIFGYRFVAGVISIFTLAKGCLLLVMVGIGGFLGFLIDQDYTDNFLNIGKPFLIGTVALGGAINTLPVIYGKMKPTKLNLHVFQIAAVLGIAVCFLLNVFWCLFILMIVPQTSSDPNEPTLEKALREQQISTVILVEVLQKNYPQFTWISYVVSIFIMVSVTVSFVTLSTGFKHMLDGYVKSFINSMRKEESLLHRIVNHPAIRWMRRPEIVFQLLLYLACWLGILVIAQLNPRSIFYVMEVFTSMSLNLEAGLFVSWMIAAACWGKFSHLNIVAPLPRWVQWFFLVVALYFLFAVGYDIVIALIDLGIWLVDFVRQLFHIS